MNLIHLGTAYGGWTVDLDKIPFEGTVLDCGVGTDMSFAEALQGLRPWLKFVMVDHTDEAETFVTKTRAYPWAEFIKKAVAPLGVADVPMRRHRTLSGSESFSPTHAFVNPSDIYRVSCVSLTELIVKYSPCLVKLDIESAEYACIREAIGVDQVCAEFHHRMDSGFTAADTEAILRDFEKAGYEIAHRTKEDEILMVRR